jgi:N-acetyltransferase 10
MHAWLPRLLPSEPLSRHATQVALEGRISQASVQASLARGHRASGDLIPWTVSQQFQDSDFAKLSGARIVRIATHPDAQRMGYGSRALELLIQHFAEGGAKGKGKGQGQGDADGTSGEEEGGEGDSESSSSGESDEEEEEEEGGGGGKKASALLKERIAPRTELPPLLEPVERVEQQRLDWLGVSYGLTEPLLTFWARAGLRLVYLRQTPNDLTGEHTAVMLRSLGQHQGEGGGWLAAFASDALRRISTLMGFEFKELDTATCLAIIHNLR